MIYIFIKRIIIGQISLLFPKIKYQQYLKSFQLTQVNKKLMIQSPHSSTSTTSSAAVKNPQDEYYEFTILDGAKRIKLSQNAKLHKGSTVRELKQKLAERIGKDNYKDCRIICNVKELKHTEEIDKQTLGEMDIESDQTIVVTYRLHGGSLKRIKIDLYDGSQIEMEVPEIITINELKKNIEIKNKQLRHQQMALLFGDTVFKNTDKLSDYPQFGQNATLKQQKVELDLVEGVKTSKSDADCLYGDDSLNH
ncbi:hypothetical protein FGO68_gene1171 [Halteria grandinella]|uniref:Ubiquitin-like domain-containing protein n=1 Tax=Halteria grandinella TaxID=5974 RepID=A0A8J8NZF2_HALGN|nr:hypothetical protein FGO68_gene1171 [Halteria grandinella]